MNKKYNVIIEDYENSFGVTKNELKIIYDKEIILEEVDNGEPEDNSFHRDYNWVKRELERAYELGLKDGKEIKNGS